MLPLGLTVIHSTPVRPGRKPRLHKLHETSKPDLGLNCSIRPAMAITPARTASETRKYELSLATCSQRQQQQLRRGKHGQGATSIDLYLVLVLSIDDSLSRTGDLPSHPLDYRFSACFVEFTTPLLASKPYVHLSRFPDEIRGLILFRGWYQPLP